MTEKIREAEFLSDSYKGHRNDKEGDRKKGEEQGMIGKERWRFVEDRKEEVE